MKTLTIIPSRLSATRLPGKPLLKINDTSIISHVFKRAEEANIGEVVVAAEDQEIVDDVVKNGGRAILTGRNHKTGTDRIYEALQKLEFKDVDLIMNLQGDEPAINIEDIVSLNKKMISNQRLSYEIWEEKVPISKNLQSYLKKNNYKKSNFISNGDDYQILFTAGADKSRIIKNIAKKLGVRISRIGKIRPNNQKSLLIGEKGQHLLIKNSGYKHQF